MDHFRIGMVYNAVTMKYEWIDGSYFVHRKWCAGQPTLAIVPDTSTVAAPQNCVFVNGASGCWEVKACTSNTQYICDAKGGGEVH